MLKPTTGPGLRLLLIIGASAVFLIMLAMQDSIPQDPDYHYFADQRTVAGVPQVLNVISNLPFLVVGGYGLYLLYCRRFPALVKPLQLIYAVFFAATVFVGLGSAYYHLDPDNFRLLWDRLPMSIAFMAFLLIIVGEHISSNWARRLLVPLILGGIGSVGYWISTEAQGLGDLRPYAAVQFLPLLLTPLILMLFPSAFSKSLFMWVVPALYLAAKVFEWLDEPVFQVTGFISGHTLKHLLAALAVYFVILALRRRKPL